jgi:hypothetical protein
VSGGWLWTQFVGGATRWQGAAGRASVNMASPAKPGERGGFCGGRICRRQRVRRRRAGEHDIELK